MNFWAILPLALTMNIGPQIITAIVVLTGTKPVRKSLVYLAGIAIAITVLGLAAFLIFGAVNSSGSTGSESTVSQVLDYVFAGLLAALGVWVFTQRKKARKPKWMASIQDAGQGRLFVMGLLLYSFFPSDFVVLLTVGQYLSKHKLNFYAIVPFLALTLFIAAVPLLSFLLFRKRAEKAMPRIQEWLDANGWVINEVVIVFFIYMMLFG
jgi:threonine/homoserine/homoserine lactone efflux protein